MSSRGVQAGPALPLWTRAPSEHPSVKGYVTCTWREPHPGEASQVESKGQSWGQSEGGGELPSGTLQQGRAAGPALGGVLARQSCQAHPGLPASSAAKRNPLTPPTHTHTTSQPPRVPPHRAEFLSKINMEPQVSAVDSELLETSQTFLALPALGAKVRGGDSMRTGSQRGGWGAWAAGGKTQALIGSVTCSRQFLPGPCPPPHLRPPGSASACRLPSSFSLSHVTRAISESL